MILPDNFTGVLLLDYRDPKKSPIKLTSEQKLLQKQTTTLLGSMISKNVSKDTNNQRILSTLIIIMKLENNTTKNVNILYKYFRFFQLSKEGRLITNTGEYKNTKKEIQLIGMDNYQNVSCYIDSVLVALFYSSSSFDFLLDKNPDIELSLKLQNEIEELKIILRFIVNLMRAGEHINTNIMYQLFLVLNSLGCDLALSGKQQDSLQLFEFLAESLSLPLLTIKLDIIHSGKLNLNDDMRLIEERTLLISVPKSPTDPKSRNSVDPPVSLEECLNTYFNNSVTVRRHLDKKRINSSLMKISAEKDASENLNNSSDDLLNTKDDDEINEYEKLGIITTRNDPTLTGINLITPVASTISDSSSSKSPNASIKQNISSNTTPNQQASSSIPPPSPSPGIDSVINYTPSLKQFSTFSSSSDSIAQLGSINNVSEKLEKSRTRSSTLVSVFNNVPVANPTKLTRRSSSISNSEVSLPAWMFLQLLPYYTDPGIKLKFENHEESYRSTIYKIRTLDSNDANSTNNNNNSEKLETSEFEKKIAKNRPIVPICLKKYYWNERGQSTKIERKVSIPEKIVYPYFIAEDKTKDGFVDFKRSCDNKAPCGSFMLILQSCVCHRGSSVNAGHYVTITRKHPNSKDWILFNDMEIGSDKVKTYTFDEVMEQEDAYLLFYEIVEIKDPGFKTPMGGKESYWGRKPSVVSGISGSSEITLQENEEESKSGSSLGKNHLMHISLPGLNLSKSHSKLTEIDDVIHEYYWNDNVSDTSNNDNNNNNKNYNNNSNNNTNNNNNNNNNNNAHINLNSIAVNSMSSTGSSSSDDHLPRSNKSGAIEYCNDTDDDDNNNNSASKVQSKCNSVKSNGYNDKENEYDLPMVSVMEVEGSSSTQLMDDDEKLCDGEVELYSENFEFRNHENGFSNSSRHSVATVGTNKTIKRKEDLAEAKKSSKKNKANEGEKKKGGKIKRILKKFLN